MDILPFITSNYSTQNTRTGQQGDCAELLFMQMAISHGYDVMFPFNKNSVFDVALYTPQQKFLRVQVRSSASLDIKTDRYQMRAVRGKDKKKKFNFGEVDFFAVYVVPRNVWYIIPAYCLAKRVTFFFRPHRPSHDPCARFREAWDLLTSTARAA